jgi:VPDSG-CTERM motif
MSTTHAPGPHIKTMKKYVLATLMAMALACSAHAVTDNNDNGRPGNPGHVNKVPDTGSTAALLGLAVALMVLGRRTFATVH